MMLRRAVGTVRWMEEGDLSEREEVAIWMRSVR